MALKDTIGRLLARLLPADPAPESTTETGRGVGEVSGGVLGAMGAWYYDQVKVEQTRHARYRDYDLMDAEFPELSSALDIYADNATHADREPFESFEFETKDARAKKFLEEVTDRAKMREEVWTLARDLAKYGDDFNELVFDGSHDLVRVKCLDRFKTYRQEDKFGLLDPEAAFFQADRESGEPSATFPAWQVVHYRMRKTRGSRYGNSIFESARRVFKQLQLMEDGMVIGRLSRAHQRLAFLVDTGGLVGDEAVTYLDQVKARWKKRRFIDQQTGRLGVLDNPLHAEDDIWLPQGETSKSDVKVLQGQANLGQIKDVEYFRNKMFAAIKVPKAYLGIEEETRARSVITELDVQFARSVRRFQIVIALGHRQLYDRTMLVKAITPPEYQILFPPIATIDELREWQVEKLKAEVAKIWGKQINEVSTVFLLRKYLGLTDEEIAQMQLEPKPEKEVAGGPGGGAPPELPAAEEVYAQAHLANMLEALRDLVGMELAGKRWARVRDPVPRGRRTSISAHVDGDGLSPNGDEE